MPTVLLVRHGRTNANTGGTLAGWTPGISLDEKGVDQARAARRAASRRPTSGMPGGHLPAAALPRDRRRRAGPARRAIGDTGGPGIPLQVDERLGECRYGAWTGRPIPELVKEPLWRTVQDHPSAVVFPDDAQWPGESMAAMQERAVRAVREVDAQVRAEHGEQGLWIAVSHGDVIKAILADALGVHLDLFQRIHVDPASTSVVRYTDRRPFVLRTNDVGGDLCGVAPAPQPSADAVVGGGAGPDDPVADGQCRERRGRFAGSRRLRSRYAGLRVRAPPAVRRWHGRTARPAHLLPSGTGRLRAWSACPARRSSCRSSPSGSTRSWTSTPRRRAVPRPARSRPTTTRWRLPIEDEFRVNTISLGWDPQRQAVLLEADREPDLEEGGEEAEATPDEEFSVRVVLLPGPGAGVRAAHQGPRRGGPAAVPVLRWTAGRQRARVPASKRLPPLTLVDGPRTAAERGAVLDRLERGEIARCRPDRRRVQRRLAR